MEKIATVATTTDTTLALKAVDKYIHLLPALLNVTQRQSIAPATTRPDCAAEAERRQQQVITLINMLAELSKVEPGQAAALLSTYFRLYQESAKAARFDFHDCGFLKHSSGQLVAPYLPHVFCEAEALNALLLVINNAAVQSPAALKQIYINRDLNQLRAVLHSGCSLTSNGTPCNTAIHNEWLLNLATLMERHPHIRGEYLIDSALQELRKAASQTSDTLLTAQLEALANQRFRH